MAGNYHVMLAVLFIIHTTKLTWAGYNCISRCSCSLLEGEIVADCTTLNFTNIPVPEAYQVNELVMDFNHISVLKAHAFIMFTKLTIISLRGNRMRVIETGAFMGLDRSKLQRLDLSLNQLNMIPTPDLQLLSPTLASLSLSYNALRRLPSQLAGMKNLVELDVSHNSRVSVLPEGIFPPSLLILNISHTSISNFRRNDFDKLTELNVLIMSDNMASWSVNFETGIFDKLIALRYLDLSHCNCKRLPADSFTKLSKLTTLLLRANRINKLPIFKETLEVSTSGPTTTLEPTTAESNYWDNITTVVSSINSTVPSTKSTPTTFAPVMEKWFNPMLQTLDMSNNRRLTITDNGHMFAPAMNMLELSNTKINVIGSDLFSNLKNLRYLGLCRSRIIEVSTNALTNLSNLTRVCLSGNPLNRIPVLPPSVETVNLDKTRIVNLTSYSMGSLNKLIELNLTAGSLHDVTDDVFINMEHLVKVNLSSNAMTKINQRTFYIRSSSLQILDLSNNDVSTIQDDAFSSHSGLRTLNLRANQLDELTERTLKGLHGLVELDLADNGLIEIAPFALKELTNLEILSLENNELEVIFESQLSQCSKLSRLTLHNNQLLIIHPQRLPSLTMLHIGHNNLTEFPRIRAPLLESIDASYNNIQEMTYGMLEGYHGLLKLDLKSNPMLDVDYAAFRDATNLTELNLAKCMVGSFVDQPMPSLKTLFLGENSITEMNDEFSFVLPSLIRLDISFNNLTTINSSILDSTTLASVDFTGNNFICDCELVPFVAWVNNMNENLHVIVLGSPEYMCAGPASAMSQAVLHAVGELDCTPPKPSPQKGTIAMEVVLAVVATVVLLLSVTIACYCRRRVATSNASSASSMDDTSSNQGVSLHCCEWIAVNLRSRAIMRGRSRERVTSDDETRDLMNATPLASPLGEDAPELL